MIHCCILFVSFTTFLVSQQWAIAETGSSSPMTIAPIATTGEEPIAAARAGFQSLKYLVTERNARMLGFLNPAEVSLVQIDTPFPTYVVNLANLPNFDPATSNLTGDGGLVQPISRLVYPLLTDRQDGMGRKARSAVVVSLKANNLDKTKFTWTPTNWGLASIIQQVTDYRATVNGFTLGILVWIPALNLHFLGDKYTEGMMLIPLADRPAYGLRKGQPISARIVFALYAREAKALDDSNPG